MNLDQARERKCPPHVLQMLEDAGIKQLGFGLGDGEEGEIDWATVEGDMKMILARQNRPPSHREKPL